MDKGNAPPPEKEYIIESSLEPYIDRKDLEKLLLEKFKKKITVYVSRRHNFLDRRNFLRLTLLRFVAPQRCVQIHRLATVDWGEFQDSAGVA